MCVWTVWKVFFFISYRTWQILARYSVYLEIMVSTPHFVFPLKALMRTLLNNLFCLFVIKYFVVKIFCRSIELLHYLGKLLKRQQKEKSRIPLWQWRFKWELTLQLASNQLLYRNFGTIFPCSNCNLKPKPCYFYLFIYLLPQPVLMKDLCYLWSYFLFLRVSLSQGIEICAKACCRIISSCRPDWRPTKGTKAWIRNTIFQQSIDNSRNRCCYVRCYQW